MAGRALEHLDREADATAEIEEWIQKWGLERVRQAVAAHLPLRLCARSFAAAQSNAQRAEHDKKQAQRRAAVAGLEGQLAEAHAKPTWGGLIFGFFLTTAIFTVLLGSVWTCVVSGMIEADPLFGAHARIVCPRVCSDCHSPYEFVSWSTSSGSGNSDQTLNVYCHDLGGRIAGMKASNGLWMAAVQGEPWLRRYEVRGGVWFLWLTLLGLFAPISAVFTMALLVRGWTRRRARRATLAEKLEKARADLR